MLSRENPDLNELPTRADIARVLHLLEAQPRLRSTPQEGDVQEPGDTHWFDGGAMADTTGVTHYRLDDGTRAVSATHQGLPIAITFRDGTSVEIRDRTPGELRAGDQLDRACVHFWGRFLPEGVPDPHALYFDFDGVYPFVPDAGESRACFLEYSRLLQGRSLDVLCEDVMACSELALAYLDRGPGPGDAKTTRQLRKATGAVLDALAKSGALERFGDYDGVKRIRTIADAVSDKESRLWARLWPWRARTRE